MRTSRAGWFYLVRISYPPRRSGQGRISERDGVRGPAAEEHDAHHEEVRDVDTDLGEGRLRAIPDEAGEEAAGHALVAQQRGRVPERLRQRQQSQALQPADPGREETGREQHD